MLNKKYLIILIVILFGLGGLLLSNIRPVNTQSSDKVNNAKQEKDKSDDDFPLVSLDTSDTSRRVKIIDEKRKKRNEKYDKSGWVQKKVRDSVTEVRRIDDWQTSLPALPVKISDAVVVGTVNSSEAFLSNDETGVYSEFTILIDSLVKDNQSASLESDTNIIIQRAGGRVIYPTGKILRYSIHGQGMPRLNGRYVFFLAYNQPTQTYRILTAYEIANGKIIALDGKGTSKGAGFNFSKYDGLDERQFMDEIQVALNSQADSSKGVTAP
jgi:hypothetical protein